MYTTVKGSLPTKRDSSRYQRPSFPVLRLLWRIFPLLVLRFVCSWPSAEAWHRPEHLLPPGNHVASDESPSNQEGKEAVPDAGSTRDKPTSGHDRMVALLKDISDRALEEHFFLSDKKARELRVQAAGLSPNAPDVFKWELYLKLGEAEQRLGLWREAIEQYLKAYDLLPNLSHEMAPGWTERLIFGLGVAYLRLGETENCYMRNSPDSCIMPLQDGGIHVDKEPSRQAIKYFSELLPRIEEGSTNYYTVRWILNIAYMTVGAYPEEVPLRYLIPPRAFESDERFPQFKNVAHRAGLATSSLSGGAVAEDFNQDGYLDLLVSTHDPSVPARLFFNNRNGTFSERTNEAHLDGIYGGLNMVQADYDNDGDVDVLVLRGAWQGKLGRHPNSLLRNNGDGTFTDVSFEAGLAEVHYPTQTGSWADYDNDGDLDLYIGNETTNQVTAPCQLFVNHGDGTFKDVAGSAGVTNDRFSKSVIWGDFDGDRLMDLHVSNLDKPNRLYHNNGDGTFTDVAPSLGVTGPKNRSFPAWFWDFDNDGVLDIYVSAYSAAFKHIVPAYLNESFEGEFSHLYRGDGRGGFQEVAEERGLARPSAPMGANFGDLDNDGYLDFYLGTGYPDYHELMPNLMYRNRAGESFADVTMAGGFGHLQKGHGVVFADLDKDGDQDVFEETGGALPGDVFYDALYENPGFGNHWIGVELIGVHSNRSAIGARIQVQVTEKGRSRSIYKHVNSGGTFGANPLAQTIGLGKADKIDFLEVCWPTSNRVQRFFQVPLDRHIQIIETSDRYSILQQ